MAKSKLLIALGVIGALATAGIASKEHLVTGQFVKAEDRVYVVEQGKSLGTRVHPIGTNYSVIDTNKDGIADIATWTSWHNPFTLYKETANEADTNLFNYVMAANRQGAQQ